MTRPRARFCIRGHDTDIVGRRTRGNCRACENEAARNRHKHLRRRKPNPEKPLDREYLPIGPLADWIAELTIGTALENVIGSNDARSYHRAKKSGRITVLTADRIVTSLGAHPTQVWGLKTWAGVDPRPITNEQEVA